MTTEATHTPPQPAAVGAQVDRPVRPGDEAVQPIAYLYHDAASAETANPLIHSTLVVMAADRRPKLRNETALVTLAQAQAMVAAERERCAKVCEQYAWLQEEGSPARSNFRNCAATIRRA